MNTKAHNHTHTQQAHPHPHTHLDASRVARHVAAHVHLAPPEFGHAAGGDVVHMLGVRILLVLDLYHSFPGQLLNDHRLRIGSGKAFLVNTVHDCVRMHGFATACTTMQKQMIGL